MLCSFLKTEVKRKSYVKTMDIDTEVCLGKRVTDVRYILFFHVMLNCDVSKIYFYK